MVFGTFTVMESLRQNNPPQTFGKSTSPFADSLDAICTNFTYPVAVPKSNPKMVPYFQPDPQVVCDLQDPTAPPQSASFAHCFALFTPPEHAFQPVSMELIVGFEAVGMFVATNVFAFDPARTSVHTPSVLTHTFAFLSQNSSFTTSQSASTLQIFAVFICAHGAVAEHNFNDSEHQDIPHVYDASVFLQSSSEKHVFAGSTFAPLAFKQK